MGRSNGLAMPPGTDPVQLGRYLNRAHDDFVTTGGADPALRQVVVDSWRRSVGTGLDPEYSMATIVLDEDQLAEYRAAHPLAVAMPVIRRLLIDDAADAGLLVAVSDAAGQLLWVEGCPSLRARAEGMHFLPGADWSEASAGTNAPGTALALRMPVQIFGPEHLVRQVTPWSCSAAPIREPDTGAILGVLDVTGGAEVAQPQTLALVRATVAAVEAELRIRTLRPLGAPPRAEPVRDRPHLKVLGRRNARFSYGRTSTELSLRHSEIALLLAEADDGMAAAELAVALSEHDPAQVTVRAELSRLRRQLGPVRLTSRPYRLIGVRTDASELRDELGSGRLRQAVARYRGPILPASTAPGVAEVRDTVHRTLRGRLIEAGDPDALLAFADTPYGHRDLGIWTAALATLPGSSPRRTDVADYVDRLNVELAS
jgi:hypothetical protein